MPMDFPSSPTVGQQYNGYVWTGTTWDSTSAQPISLSTTAPGYNAIINGAFDIWQRGTSFTANGFVADRWKLDKPSGVTVSREASDVPSGFQYALKQVSTSSNAYTQLGQQIEFANCASLQSKTVTISFWMKALANTTGSTNVTVRTRRADAVDSAIIFSGTNNDNSITISTSWARYTVTKTLVTFGAMSLEFALPANVTGDGFLVTGVQLEEGAAATDFRRNAPSIAGELAACQRYAYVPSQYSNLGGNGGQSSGTGVQTRFAFPATMRTTPTASILTAGSWVVGNDYSANYTAGTFTIIGQNLTPQGGRVGLGGFTSMPTSFLAGSDAAGTGALIFSAEL